MENKENIQMPEINEVEVASANEVKAEENSQEPANKVEKEKKHRRICLGGGPGGADEHAGHGCRPGRSHAGQPSVGEVYRSRHLCSRIPRSSSHQGCTQARRDQC